MAKNNQKCVRLSDEVLEIVENYRGNGFNEKFDNLVIDYFNDIPKRKADLDRIDRLISLKQDQLNKVCERINQIDALINNLNKLGPLLYEATQITGFLKVVSQPKELQKLQEEVNEIQPPRKKYKQVVKE